MSDLKLGADLAGTVGKIVAEALGRRDRKLSRQRDLLTLLNIARIRALPPETRLRDAEFRVFSQNGEDGIIQFILRHCPEIPEIFVEFGVQTYAEANTRLLLELGNWRGLILDGDPRLEAEIIENEFYWRHDLLAKSAFITRDNINELLSGSGLAGDIGLLSVDIDGNDYWVWQAIDAVNPAVVVCEYNSVFGPDLAVSVPYREDFERRQAHYSALYFGCSLAALCFLAERKGFDFIGSNSFGNNAFFIRRDLGHPFLPLTARAGYVESRFRESLDRDGNRNYLRGPQRRGAIAHLPVIDVATGAARLLGRED
jgi:hypothetical protein